MKKIFSILFSAILLFSLAFCFTANAASVSEEKTYKPLDLVVVLDNSGSMNDSDPSRTALAAVRMLVNMMPAADSRVAVIGFNRTPNPLTKNGAGTPVLIGLENLSDIEKIRSSVANVIYKGGTAIGNALFAATELLDKNKDPDRAKAIILFTDGMNDLAGNPIAYSTCEENEASAIMWANNNDCPIYCVGYDYITDTGVSSMGANGEGMLKLKNIADSTGGKVKAINTAKEIEQLLIDFLADVCDLNYKTVATIPGDGGKHDTSINISASVIEANIRIAGADNDSIKTGKIQLFDPQGREIELRNSGNVRFDTDATAASIKVTMPSTGTWILSVEGITGDNIHVGLLEHFKMNLSTTLTFPEGNPPGVAYNNDTIGIRAWLSYDGVDLNDEAIYAAVKSATATCIPRANPDNKKIITLQRDGMAFTGDFTIPQDCYYDITVRLDWDTVYREAALEIGSNNRPPYMNADIPTVKVNKNKTATLSNIYQFVTDDENDPVTAGIASVTSPDVADITISGNDLVVTGKKMSSTIVHIDYKDDQGNTISTSVKVRVNDPIVWITLAIIILLCIIAALLIPYLSYLKSLKIKGNLYFASVEYSEPDTEHENGTLFEFTGTGELSEIISYPGALSISMNLFYKKKENRNLKKLLEATEKLLSDFEYDTDEYKAKALLAESGVRTLTEGAEKCKITGSPNGATFTVSISKKMPGLKINKNTTKSTIANEQSMEVVFRKNTSISASDHYIRLKYYFESHVRSSKKAKRR